MNTRNEFIRDNVVRTYSILTGLSEVYYRNVLVGCKVFDKDSQYSEDFIDKCNENILLADLALDTYSEYFTLDETLTDQTQLHLLRTNFLFRNEKVYFTFIKENNCPKEFVKSTYDYIDLAVPVISVVYENTTYAGFTYNSYIAGLDELPQIIYFINFATGEEINTNDDLFDILYAKISAIYNF